jgi:hypothetical protein
VLKYRQATRFLIQNTFIIPCRLQHLHIVPETFTSYKCFFSDLACLGPGVSSGSTVSDYGLDDRAISVRSPAGAKDLSSSLFVQTGSGAHPASCTMGTGGPFPGGKSAAGA